MFSIGLFRYCSMLQIAINLGIWKSALVGWTSASGGLLSASSMAVMPKDLRDETWIFSLLG